MKNQISEGMRERWVRKRGRKTGKGKKNDGPEEWRKEGTNVWKKEGNSVNWRLIGIIIYAHNLKLSI